MMLGLSQIKIQTGVGSGTIAIEKVDISKSIILCSTINQSYGDGDVVNNNYHATFLGPSVIHCATTMAWTVIEFGGAV